MHEGTILVTGGCGFIGANFILDWLASGGGSVVNLDRLTYAGNPDNLQALARDRRYRLVRGDIADQALVARLLAEHQPVAVLNFAAESHVDRSIEGPAAFLHTNVMGVFALLEAVRGYWQGLPPDRQRGFRFLQVSTDEVYGSLAPEEAAFHEATRYAPNSPYSASKAAADHLVRAWSHTYGLPVLTTNCSNNYGPFQFPEKLIPRIILSALDGQPLPVYGDGQHIRDWLYVGDHCEALRLVLARGQVGDTYVVGGLNEQANIEVVRRICVLLDELRPRADGGSYAAQIRFVTDRPGHDRRYAVDAGKLRRELDWQPRQSFASGLRRTVAWYLDHPDWLARIRDGSYRQLPDLLTTEEQ